MVMLGGVRRIHFVGIGGIGMSGIAELLVNLGYVVSGSDLRPSDITTRLERLGVILHEGHAAAHVDAADVVVISSAVGPDNPEVAEARRRGVAVIARAEMLAELMRLRFSIAVAGSHGKTTTTSMIAIVLERAGLDPTAVIGGRLRVFGSNARLGRGDYLVAEADESDRSFLVLSPSIAVITNIDQEHMESYSSFDALQSAFAQFANKVPFYGSVVACADDPHVTALLPQLTRTVVTYGFDENAAVRGTDVELGSFGGRCVVRHRHADVDEQLGVLELSVPGRHNLQNALAAVAVGARVGVGFAQVADALRTFDGAERRFERRGEAGGVLVIDDYGHHPTEIAAVLAAARATFDRRLLVVFQPHRYTRTQQQFHAFGPALGAADAIVLTDIYPAGEAAIPGISAATLADAMRRGAACPVHLAGTLDAALEQVVRLARPGDVVITLGAGSVGTLPPRLLDALGRLEAGR